MPIVEGLRQEVRNLCIGNAPVKSVYVGDKQIRPNTKIFDFQFGDGTWSIEKAESEGRNFERKDGEISKGKGISSWQGGGIFMRKKILEGNQIDFNKILMKLETSGTGSNTSVANYNNQRLMYFSGEQNKNKGVGFSLSGASGKNGLPCMVYSYGNKISEHRAISPYWDNSYDFSSGDYNLSPWAGYNWNGKDNNNQRLYNEIKQNGLYIGVGLSDINRYGHNYGITRLLIQFE